MADYIYAHWDAFRLILCQSEGTPYCHLVEEMAAQKGIYRRFPDSRQQATGWKL